VRPFVSRTRVIKDEVLAVYVPLSCQQCEEAPCKKVCPINAIDRDENTGAVTINEDICIRCRICLIFCPFGAIGEDPYTKRMVKCDLCGGDPKCVRWCPSEAIRYEEAQDAVFKKQRLVVKEHLAEGVLGAIAILEAGEED